MRCKESSSGLVRIARLQNVRTTSYVKAGGRFSLRVFAIVSAVMLRKRASGVLQYDERRCKLARMAASQHGLHAAAVLAGGGVSDAEFSVMKGDGVEMQCGWCQKASAATWHYLCWECGAFARGRPPEPSDFMQSRMAWPMGRDADYDRQVILHMLSVRSLTAEAFHSSDTGR